MHKMRCKRDIGAFTPHLVCIRRATRHPAKDVEKGITMQRTQSRGVYFKTCNLLSSIFTPGYGRCLRCKGRWNVVEPHTTFYTASSGYFVLCDVCWEGLATPDRRLLYYIHGFVLSGQPVSERNAKWCLVKAAVLAGR